MQSSSVLVVCTANVCRSPLAARLLAEALPVPVTSAGSKAWPGMGACPASSPDVVHASVRLDADHVRSAALVLGAARVHRSAAVALVPSAQSKAFTLLQAARIAGWLSARGVTAPPGLSASEHLSWWVEELDAARGDAPRGEDDLLDPHEGVTRHEAMLPLLTASVTTLAGVLAPPAAR